MELVLQLSTALQLRCDCLASRLELCGPHRGRRHAASGTAARPASPSTAPNNPRITKSVALAEAYSAAALKPTSKRQRSKRRRGPAAECGAQTAPASSRKRRHPPSSSDTRLGSTCSPYPVSALLTHSVGLPGARRLRSVDSSVDIARQETLADMKVTSLRRVVSFPGSSVGKHTCTIVKLICGWQRGCRL
jgi:hypothetical protein